MARHNIARKSGNTRTENIRTAQDVRRLARTCEGLGVPYKWTGLCLWAYEGAGTKAAEQLVRMGANWSAKKGAHYWRIPDGHELPRTIEGVTA